MDRYKPSLNNDIREVRSRIAKMSGGNKTGIPFKKNVDDVKKSLVSKWKRERVRNLEKKYVMIQVVYHAHLSMHTRLQRPSMS
jgi:hypothetical protein